MGKKVYETKNSPPRSKKRLQKLKDREEKIPKTSSSNKKISKKIVEEIIENDNQKTRHKMETEKVTMQYIRDQDNEEENFVDESDDDFLLEKLKKETKIENKEKEQKEKAQKKIAKSKKSAKKKIEKKEKSVFSNDSKKPLLDKKFVFTGLFKQTDDRDSLRAIVESLGGKVTSAVSGVTDVLVHGYILEDNRSVEDSRKYKTAVEKGTIILNENEFSEALRKKTGKPLSEYLGKQMYIEEDINESYLNSFNECLYKEQKNETNEKINLFDIIEIEEKDNSNKLWVDKYKPQTSSQIIGNKENINLLSNWLKKWKFEKNIGKTAKKESSKAVLISGPPGIGKTTAAVLISKELGYDYVIKNASDLRNKKGVNSLLTVLENNQVLNLKGKIKKCVIIMDEVDGMQGDKGGVKELISQIKTTHQPIICICNDRQSKVMRDLAPYCFDIKFKTPDHSSLMKLFQMIITHERGADIFNHIDKSILTGIIQNSNGDVRQIITYLEMWLDNYDVEKENLSSISQFASKDKFSFCNPFEATKKLLNFKLEKNVDLHQMKRYFFTDYNLMDSFVFENYLNGILINKEKEKPTKSQNQRLKTKKFKNVKDIFEDDVSDVLYKINKAIDSISYGDIISKKIKQTNNYSILNDFCFFSAIKPTLSFARINSFAHFPSYLAKLQTYKKKSRLLRELKDHYSNHTNILSNSAVIDYSKVISNCLGLMITNKKFEEAFDLERRYDIDPESTKENLGILMEFYSPGNFLSKITVKSKTNFTKFYNTKMSLKREKDKKTKSTKIPKKLKEDDQDFEEEELDNSENSFINDEDEFI